MGELDFEELAAAESTQSTITLSPEKEAEYQRIVRNLQEYTGGDIIRKVLADGEVVRAYWGQFGTL